MLLSRLNNPRSECTLLGLLITRGLRRQQPPPGKPPILPPAKRVLYAVSHTKWDEPEHVEELLWRRHVYNNAMVSLRKVFAQEIQQKEREGLATESLRKQELEELDLLIAENERRNLEADRLRHEKEESEMDNVKKEINDDIEERLNKERVYVEQKAEEVKQVIERSANFITFENLDERINKALEEPVVFDFAMDLKGTKIYDPPPVNQVANSFFDFDRFLLCYLFVSKQSISVNMPNIFDDTVLFDEHANQQFKKTFESDVPPVPSTSSNKLASIEVQQQMRIKKLEKEVQMLKHNLRTVEDRLATVLAENSKLKDTIEDTTELANVSPIMLKKPTSARPVLSNRPLKPSPNPAKQDISVKQSVSKPTPILGQEALLKPYIAEINMLRQKLRQYENDENPDATRIVRFMPANPLEQALLKRQENRKN
ncbi:hypothetical protein M3Y97_00091600 [Aphelenchoides bicaudatus]|nr:hypothetical protein M3Y97_00091600 [Aphelenchoides bicaudatus]